MDQSYPATSEYCPEVMTAIPNTSQIDLFAPPANNDGETEAPPAYNFRLMGRRKLGEGWRERAAGNIAAMKLAAKIESEGRHATEQEQAVLIKFVGFGATDLSKLFRDDPEKGWESVHRDLRRLAVGHEFAELRRSTQYAHYTPEFMVTAMWRALRRMGFTGGAVLDPGCGTGMFVAMMPEGIAMRSSYLGVEADPTTARIARLLYPESDIMHADFTRATIPGGFDLAIGNPPFARIEVKGKHDPVSAQGFTLHNYFIARSIERLRPGGLAAFVVSRYVMDAAGASAREFIAGMADLLGAIRMPEGAMRAAAGTEVVVDILFFRKRAEGEASNGIQWTEATKHGLRDHENKLHCVNSYFVEHPKMVLGTHAIGTSQFGPAYTCKPGAVPLDILLSQAIHGLPERIYVPSAEPGGKGGKSVTLLPGVRVGTAAEGAAIKEGSFLVLDGKLCQIIDGAASEVQVKAGQGTPGIFRSHERVIRDMIPVRDAVREVLRTQVAGEPHLSAQAELHRAYDAFVKAHGPINTCHHSEKADPNTGVVRETYRYPNLAPFRDDPDCPLMASIEEYDTSTGTASKGPIFDQCVVSPPPQLSIATPADALAVVLNECGKVSIPRIAELLSLSEEAAIAALKTLIYLEPASGEWVTDDEYLSGMVRDKLTKARAAALVDARFDRNVDALEGVQPPDLGPKDISVRLGAAWIPAEVVAQFCEQVIGIKTQIAYLAEINQWSINMDPFGNAASATTDWGTPKRHAGKLLLDALTSTPPKIMKKVPHPEKFNEFNYVVDPEATEAAKEKLDRIKTAFENWVWDAPERVDLMVPLYNKLFNNLVPREFNGDHLVLPGASNVIDMRQHQKRAVWREIAAGSTYWAHTVGAGKTFGAIAALMEQRRLGLIVKPIVVVPNHTLMQWAREWMMLYPQARILVADEENFAKDKRRRFLARATTGMWDAIIITHSAFKFIPTPRDFEHQMILDQLAEADLMLEEVDKTQDRVAVKKIEAIKERMHKRLEALDARKDDLVHIGEIGIDKIVVDEAQEFRKLYFATNTGGLKGIDPNGSQRAWDLYVKVKFLEERKNPKRAISLLSGTPITNTMGELFSLLRFMHESGLKMRGIGHFDAWAATFGDTKVELELLPSGNYKPQTRFAQFVNIPELINMFRDVADVVLIDDLREYVALPQVKGGKRRVMTYQGSDAFKAYQELLGARIECIENRSGPPEPGDDIILVVINDGRHVAIDTRLVNPIGDLDRLDSDFVNPDDYDTLELRECMRNDPGNKLNGLIDNAFRIWKETADNEYVNPATGRPYARRGAAQMIFSDLGTEGAEATRGFSAYTWMRQRLVQMGVPPEEIAFMQHYKKSAQKLRLFADVNAGKVRFLIGSSETMGTGVNAQQRLIALHHLDVPWLPSLIEQREGRIRRQGNQNPVIEIYAYATLGSMDATMWQTVERKMRFIDAILRGDRSIRKLDDLDAESTADQFAMAKALASGDGRLMKKAGLEVEIAKLQRQRRAHSDAQMNVRRQISWAKESVEAHQGAIDQVKRDIETRKMPATDDWKITIEGQVYTDRELAAKAIEGSINTAKLERRVRGWGFGEFAGFTIEAESLMVEKPLSSAMECIVKLHVRRSGQRWSCIYKDDLRTGQGIMGRLEELLRGFDYELRELEDKLVKAHATIRDYEPRLNSDGFEWQEELDAKLAEWEQLTRDLSENSKDKQKLAA